ncbi:hypothetical protein ACQP2U_42430 (plasmid) [Nocardia sp. CA-084685]|uniref:hypothetical protein n=1 Tax=Nocardia sp. CA-084685 TaxID=3239970 RepID=UPI003D9693BE
MSEEFKERRWHWWLSRVVVPSLVAVVALGGLLYVNRDKPRDDEAPTSMASSNERCSSDHSGADAVWGPDRPTVGPSDYSQTPSFNIERDNPHHGDERNFVQIKESSHVQAGAWADQLEVRAGHEYFVRVLLHNGARDGDEYVAKDTRVEIDLPLCSGRSIALQAVISSSNAFPQKIWDGVVLRSAEPFKVDIVPGSARLLSNKYPNPGLLLPDRVATADGTLVGSQAADGNFRRDYANDADVVITVRVLSA